MEFHPKVSMTINGHAFSYRLFEALEGISNYWSQREAAKKLGISHAVLNRRIRESEEKLGFLLVETSGSGSGLTLEGSKILERYQRYLNRLKDRDKPVICGGYIATGLLDVLSHHYGLEAVIYSTDDENAIEMAEMDLVDVLVLDDPVHAFLRDLDFYPIAFDHLVLVSGAEKNPRNLDDLEGGKFVEVPFSAQRLAWNTLDNLGIDYKIVNLCSSPTTALKMVHQSDNLHTFLNSSFTSGSDLLAEDTRHLISLVLWNKNRELKDFLEYILGRGQIIIENWGFERIV
ncbi:MAG: LysR family transcriptional regulator [Methanobacteriaceae archaeon]